MSERERRISENEALFRSVNEQVNDLTQKLATPAETMSIVCECGDQSCIEHIAIAPEKYSEVREDSALFAIRPGHEIHDAEVVVSKREGFWVVRKRPGEPEAIARATDLRR
jgi:hypothetical protein